MSELTVKIKYFDRPDYTIRRLEKISKGDWIDLYAAEDKFIPEITPGEPYKPQFIPLGVAMKLPDGYEAHLAPRSSEFKNFGLIQTNSVGIIDNSYCGDDDQWMQGVICLSGHDTIVKDGKTIYGTQIHKGDKICQFRIMETMPALSFKEMPHLEGKNRGGFGSTGRT